MLDHIHEKYTYDRRVLVLADHIAKQITPNSSILDIGCGDGQISELIAEKAKALSIRGIDVMARSISNIDVKVYDGIHIPEEGNSFDACMFVDVLHHADDAFQVLKEATRVARKQIIIKDHLADGFLSPQILKFMDYVGNSRHGVSLPYHYLKKDIWYSYFEELNLEVDNWQTKLKIYPFWCSWAFDRKLHFIARLSVN